LEVIRHAKEKYLNTDKTKYIVLLVIGLLILFCYALAGFCFHPSADDFTYAIIGKTDNFLQAILNERYRWNGRYSSNFLVVLLQ
jgi:hypothetical protein